MKPSADTVKMNHFCVCEKMKVTVSRRCGSQFASAIINFLRKTEHPVESHPTHRTSQQELQILGTIAALVAVYNAVHSLWKSGVAVQLY